MFFSILVLAWTRLRQSHCQRTPSLFILHFSIILSTVKIIRWPVPFLPCSNWDFHQTPDPQDFWVYAAWSSRKFQHIRWRSWYRSIFIYSKASRRVQALIRAASVPWPATDGAKGKSSVDSTLAFKSVELSTTQDYQWDTFKYTRWNTRSSTRKIRFLHRRHGEIIRLRKSFM